MLGIAAPSMNLCLAFTPLVVLPRAYRDGETYTMLLHYVNCQSAAAAQATAVACGAYHTSALLIPEPSNDIGQQQLQVRHSLYTFGRGFHGQLGAGNHESQKEPVHVSLGFRPAMVSVGCA
jgi:E3 ubiquitin-protein ligase HERC3